LDIGVFLRHGLDDHRHRIYARDPGYRHGPDLHCSRRQCARCPLRSGRSKRRLVSQKTKIVLHLLYKLWLFDYW